MAARRNGDGEPPKRGHSSRRSYSSSPARSAPAPAPAPAPSPSRSPSPRTKRLRRAQEERDLARGKSSASRSPSPRTKSLRRAQEERGLGRSRGRSRDNGTTRDRDRDRDRDRGQHRDMNREREKDADRFKSRDRSRDRGHAGDRRGSRGEEGPRDKRAREREPERSRDISRDRRGGRERPVGTSPPVRSRSPVRSRRYRSPSPKDVQQRRRRSPSRSKSPPPRHQIRHEQRTNAGTAAAVPDENGDDVSRERTRGEDSPQQDDSVARMKEVEAALEVSETNKEKPSFEYSGKLAAETNKVKGVTLQFTEPPEARKPNTRWRLYVFKDGEPLNEPLYIHRQTCYLFGRERRVADVPTDHPSCSKQHAVIQYRLTEKEEPDGMPSSKVRPYVMDLGSTNGTMLNSELIDPQRYYEMFEKDTLKFGNSSREYVLLHEHSMG